jgi:hypothetical protein
VGIGTSNPLQKLEVNGAIKIGNTGTNEPGSIRYQNGNFEGGDGSAWKSFAALPSNAMILARRKDTAALKQAGFELYCPGGNCTTGPPDRELFTETPTLPGQWSATSVSYLPPDEYFGTSSSEACVHYNGKLILFDSYNMQFNEFDPSTEAWTKLTGASCPLEARQFHSMTLLDNDIYIYGGIGVTGQFLKDGARYNLLTNTWSALPDLPINLAYHATCNLFGEIWFIGGLSENASIFSARRSMFKYNPISVAFSSELANPALMPIIYQGNAHVRNNKIILVSFDSIVEYDSDALTYAKIKDLRVGGLYESELVGDDIYLVKKSPYFDFTNEETSLVDRHFKINLVSGTIDLLSMCPYANSSLIYQFFHYVYIPSLNKAYCAFFNINENARFFQVFSETGSSACTFDGYINTKIFYMIKK